MNSQVLFQRNKVCFPFLLQLCIVVSPSFIYSNFSCVEMVKAAPNTQQSLNQLLKLSLKLVWLPTELGMQERSFQSGSTAITRNHVPLHLIKHVTETIHTWPSISSCMPTHPCSEPAQFQLFN